MAAGVSGGRSGRTGEGPVGRVAALCLALLLALTGCSLVSGTPRATASRRGTATATSTGAIPAAASATVATMATLPPAPTSTQPPTPAPTATTAASPAAGATPTSGVALCHPAPPLPGLAAAPARPVSPIAPGGTPPPPRQTPPTIPLPRLDARYTLAIDDVRFDSGHLRARETIQATNREDCALDRLFLSVTAARWGWFTLDGARVDGQPVMAVVGGTVLPVALARPLRPGATATLAFDFHLDVGTADDPYTPDGFAGTTKAADILRLAYWFPILSDDHQYPPFLDPPYTATADYDVTLTAPADLVVAHTGVDAGDQPNADGTVTRHITAPRVRDFVLSLSSDYKILRGAAANGVAVEVYYSPRSFPDAATAERQARAALDAGAAAIARLSALIGPYPYPIFRIADGGAGLGGGIEFPMLVSVNLNGSGVAPLVYHETAHQWLYGILGTRTQQDPWIDEGGASFLAAYLGGTLPATPPGPERFRYPLDIAVWQVPAGGSQAAAYQAIYDQGEAFYQRVRLAMGDDNFWAALQALYRDDRYGIITPRDLLAHWQAHSPVDLTPIFREYVPSDE
ncbi:MAG TPA: hypothetical protein VFL91_09830 [Thermomicrobiales bacterium]|nr:hypothetical protein [Thermomicrobiales bacterium]